MCLQENEKTMSTEIEFKKNNLNIENFNQDESNTGPPPLNEIEIELLNKIFRENDEHLFKAFFENNIKHIRIDIFLNKKKETLLSESIKLEKNEFVNFLIEKGADLSLTDNYGRSAIEIALLTNEGEYISKLINENYRKRNSDILKIIMVNDLDELYMHDLNTRDRSGSTLLHYIAARNKIELLNVLKAEKIQDLTVENYNNIKDNEGYSCVHRAASTSHLDMLNELIRLFIIKLDFTCSFTMSLLKTILKDSNDVNILKWWFESAVSTLPAGFIDDNLLMFEISGKRNKVIIEKLEYLESMGGSLKIRNKDGNNLMLHFIQTLKIMNRDLFNYLIHRVNIYEKNKYKQDASHLAAKNGNLNVLNELIIPMVSTDSFNYTPFMYAIKYGHMETVKWFLHIFQPDFNLIHVAILNKRFLIYEILTGKDFKQTFRSIKTTCVFKWTNVYQFHARNINNYEIANEDGDYIDNIDAKLILAIFKHYSLDEIIELEIYRYRDDIGASALHVAAAFGRNDIIKWLYSNKKYDFSKYVSLYSTDLFGYTALHYAALNCKISTVTLLQSLGLDFIYNPKSNPNPFLTHIVAMYKFNKKFHFNYFIQEMLLSIKVLRDASKTYFYNNNNNLLSKSFF